MCGLQKVLDKGTFFFFLFNLSPTPASLQGQEGVDMRVEVGDGM